MKTVFAPILALALVSSCAKAVPKGAVSVADIIDNIHAWDGETVTVHGWLGQCQKLSCVLYASLSDAIIVESQRPDQAKLSAAIEGVSIGSSKTFDNAAAQLQFSEVIIRGKVSDECRGLFVDCTDRGPDLYPISIASYSSERAN
jgi:hypothetical protein